MPSKGGLTAAQRGDVRVAPMARQHGEQHGAEQVAFGGGIRAGERQRTVRHPGVEQSGLLEIVDEERQLPERRDRGRRIPFDVNPAGKGVRDRRPSLNHRLFTRRLSKNILLVRFHPGRFRRFGHNS
jgi:hypothetical protein